VEVDDEPPEHDEADGIAAATKIRAAMRRGGGGDGGAPPGAAVGGGGGEEGGAPALVVGLRQNHSSREPIARNILTTLVDDIMTHRHTPIFMHPVEIDVPGYRDAVKK
jgi:hypothetical protein